MQEFRCLNYCTIYSAEQNGKIVRCKDNYPCFEHIFNNYYNGITYKIWMCIDNSLVKDQKNNYCLFTNEQIIRHISLLHEFYPFEIKVCKEGKDFICVELIVPKDLPHSFHKYLLTWVRYLYEFPYNVLLLDAYYVKKHPVMLFESIANLFNLCLSCYCKESRDIHQITNNNIVKRLTNKELLEQIKEVSKLNNIYKELSNKDKLIPENIGNYTYKDLEYWKEGIDVRIPIYLDTYNIQSILML